MSYRIYKELNSRKFKASQAYVVMGGVRTAVTLMDEERKLKKKKNPSVHFREFKKGTHG